MHKQCDRTPTASTCSSLESSTHGGEAYAYAAGATVAGAAEALKTLGSPRKRVSWSEGTLAHSRPSRRHARQIQPADHDFSSQQWTQFTLIATHLERVNDVRALACTCHGLRFGLAPTLWDAEVDALDTLIAQAEIAVLSPSPPPQPPPHQPHKRSPRGRS
eukprot:6012882-Prymnesium_polylepis.1